MKTRLKLLLLVTAVLAIVIYHTRISRACSPQAFMPEPIFINTLHPDLPIGPYTNGNLGVIQPTYATIYLYVAYRNLMGHAFTPVEQDVLWKGDTRLLTGRALPSGAPEQASAPIAGNQDWIAAWFSTVGQAELGLHTPPDYLIPGSGTTLGVYRHSTRNSAGGIYYNQFLNCQEDAFREAVSTFKRLSHQFGETSSVVKNWIQAQQTVFGDCSGGIAIPNPLPSGVPEIARQARAYQIAAAHFYSGGYGQAVADFRAIAQDASSPWSTIAPYLVARSFVRKATMVEIPGPDPTALAQAEAEVDLVLSNPRYAKYHHAAEQLRGFIEFRLHPRQRLVELANNLTRRSGDPNMAQDATDFKLLFPIVERRQAYNTPQPISSKLYSQLADVRAKSDLLDWMITLRFSGADAHTHSLARWERTHSQAWLVAALTKAGPRSPDLSRLLSAAHRVPQSSPAYDSVTFQSLRLLLLQGHRKAVRERLDHLHIRHLGLVAPGLAATQPSTVNLFLALRFDLAQTPQELFEYAPRVAATITSGNSSQELPDGIWEPPGSNNFHPSAARLDDDGVMVFNRLLPVALLAKAVRSPELPENLRQQIALAAWTRAVLLGKSSVARSLAPSVETFAPELRPSVQAYNRAATPAARHFAVAFAVLRFPGLSPFVTTLNRLIPLARIDNYRNNWWGTIGPICAPPNPYTGRPGYPPAPQWPQLSSVLKSIYPGGKMKPPAFLTARENAEAASEWKHLIAIGPAPDYLTAQVLAWAKAHPSDPRVSEALALAVKSTRFGCSDKETGKLSKEAFDLLLSR